MVGSINTPKPSRDSSPLSAGLSPKWRRPRSNLTDPLSPESYPNRLTLSPSVGDGSKPPGPSATQKQCPGPPKSTNSYIVKQLLTPKKKERREEMGAWCRSEVEVLGGETKVLGARWRHWSGPLPLSLVTPRPLL